MRRGGRGLDRTGQERKGEGGKYDSFTNMLGILVFFVARTFVRSSLYILYNFNIYVMYY